MFRYSLPVLLVLQALVAATGCRTEASPPRAPEASAGPETPAAVDASDTILRVIEKLEAERSAGDGKLERFLADPDPRVRARAALAIGRIADPKALPAVAYRLRDDAPTVRAAALLAVGLNRDGRFLREVRARAKDGDAFVRQRAVEALGRIGSPRALPVITGALEDRDVGVACAAADACFRIRDARAVEPLAAVLAAGPPLLRFHAANALERLQVPAVDPISERPLALEPEIAAAVKVAERALLEAAGDRDAGVAAAALYALARRGRALDDIGPVKRALGSAHPEVVAAALAAIRPQQDEEAVQAHTRLLDHENVHVRWTAVKGLGVLNEVVKSANEGGMRDHVEDRVRRVFTSDPEMTIRAAAMVTLALLRGADILPELQPYLHHADVRLRRGLALAAGVVGGTRALTFLQRLQTDDDVRVRLAAVSGLAEMGGEAATQRLYRALEDRGIGVRARAAEALRDRGDPAAAGPLLKAYRASQDDPSVASGEARYRILQALAHLGGRRYREVLDEALDDPSILVRNGVVRMLEILNGFRPEVKFDPGASSARPPAVKDLPPRRNPEVVLYTNKGEIHLELYPDVAPAHVKAFLSLVRNGFYHGKIFHRVVTHHVVQCGDPEGTGYGSLDFSLPDEPSGEAFTEGALGMAKLGRDTGCCQFFITMAPRPHLDGEYTLFGRVQQGMGVVKRLLPGDRIVRATWMRTEARRPEAGGR